MLALIARSEPADFSFVSYLTENIIIAIPHFTRQYGERSIKRIIVLVALGGGGSGNEWMNERKEQEMRFDDGMKEADYYQQFLQTVRHRGV